jgi:hypothetical protein
MMLDVNEMYKLCSSAIELLNNVSSDRLEDHEYCDFVDAEIYLRRLNDMLKEGTQGE